MHKNDRIIIPKICLSNGIRPFTVFYLHFCLRIIKHFWVVYSCWNYPSSNHYMFHRHGNCQVCLSSQGKDALKWSRTFRQCCTLSAQMFPYDCPNSIPTWALVHPSSSPLFLPNLRDHTYYLSSSTLRPDLHGSLSLSSIFWYFQTIPNL